MTQRVPLFAVLAVILLLAGCSKAPELPPDTSAPPPSYAAVARGRVAVKGGLLSLTMPVAGTLSKVAVHEGDHVQRGQILASVDSAPAQSAVDMAQAQREQARANAKLLQVQLAAARQHARRLTAAAAAGAGAGQSADAATASVAQLTARLDAAHAASAIARNRLAAARYTLARDTLRAPVDAEVVSVTAQAGASVSPQSGTLFVLLPQRRHIVRAELSTSYVSAVHTGMHAQVSAEDSQDSTPIAAHVLRVGAVVGPSTLEDDPGLRATTRTVQCVLAFDQPSTLRIGQRVLVRFKPGASTASD